MNESIFDKLDFGVLKPLLDDDDITDISYSNHGQVWIPLWRNLPFSVLM